VQQALYVGFYCADTVCHLSRQLTRNGGLSLIAMYRSSSTPRTRVPKEHATGLRGTTIPSRPSRHFGCLRFSSRQKRDSGATEEVEAADDVPAEVTADQLPSHPNQAKAAPYGVSLDTFSGPKGILEGYLMRAYSHTNTATKHPPSCPGQSHLFAVCQPP
jgi:hypothetical protein